MLKRITKTPEETIKLGIENHIEETVTLKITIDQVKGELSQKNIYLCDKLKNVINTLKIYDLDLILEGLDFDKNLEELDSLKLAEFIDNQAKEIIKIKNQKDKLLSNLERQNQELNDYAHMVSHDFTATSRATCSAQPRMATAIVFGDVFEVFQTCENLYYASWTHVTSLERL